MKDKIDLNTCEPGDKLISCLGAELEYVEYTPVGAPFNHKVKFTKTHTITFEGEKETFRKGNMGSRTDDGSVWENVKQPGLDHDIVKIIKKDKK